MIPLKITLDPETEARAEALFGRLADRAANVEGGLRNVGEALLEVTDARFGSQTDPSGKAWAPLAPLTKEIRGNDGPILTVSGRLRKSISYQVGGNALRLGPNAEGDAVQQFGATIVPRSASVLRIPLPIGVGPASSGDGAYALRVKVPARPYIGFGPRDEAAARDAIDEWLEVEEAETD